VVKAFLDIVSFFYDVRTESLEATGENFLGSCHEFNGRLSLARKLGGENQSFTGAEAFRDQQMMRERRLV